MAGRSGLGCHAGRPRRVRGAAGPTDDASQTQTSDVAAESTATPGAPGAGALLEPEVADVPDVVADVNGEPITREDFVDALQEPVPADGRAVAGHRAGRRPGRAQEGDGRQHGGQRAAYPSGGRGQDLAQRQGGRGHAPGAGDGKRGGDDGGVPDAARGAGPPSRSRPSRSCASCTTPLSSSRPVAGPSPEQSPAVGRMCRRSRRSSRNWPSSWSRRRRLRRSSAS